VVFVPGSNGPDSLDGSDGTDVMSGRGGNDRLRGGPGDDILYGGAGNDIVYGGASDDELSGGLGRDLLLGRDGHDLIDGGDGDDLAYGNTGDDGVFGSFGTDTVFGGGGDDFVSGEAGRDYVYGGSGFDLFGAYILEADLDHPGNDQVFPAAEYFMDFSRGEDSVLINYFDPWRDNLAYVTFSQLDDNGDGKLTGADTGVRIRDVTVGQSTERSTIINLGNALGDPFRSIDQITLFGVTGLTEDDFAAG
jgi:Ca2+-binding RTX toxin-like protein